MTLNGMDSLLSHQYFKTENKTEMNSDVFTVLLPTVNNTNLTEPVNFTIQHKKVWHLSIIHASIHPSIHPSNPFLSWVPRKYLNLESSPVCTGKATARTMKADKSEGQCNGLSKAAGFHTRMRTTQCAAALTFQPLPSYCKLPR